MVIGCAAATLPAGNRAMVRAAAADEKPLSTRMVSVGLFKNGLAVVRRTATVPGSGTYRVVDVPAPIVAVASACPAATSF